MLDIEAIAAGIKVDSRSAAQHWIDALYRRFANLGSMPGIGTSRPDIGRDVRLFPAGQYVILYRQEADGVDIIRVIHGKRDPETWL
jgi:toxin ParE1/3/4